MSNIKIVSIEVHELLGEPFNVVKFDRDVFDRYADPDDSNIVHKGEWYITDTLDILDAYKEVQAKIDKGDIYAI